MVKKNNNINFWRALIRNLSLSFLLPTTTVSYAVGSMWLGRTFEVSLGHAAKERVAGVD